MQLSLNDVSVVLVNESMGEELVEIRDECPTPAICPLNQIRAGVAVRIKHLSASPDLNHRLREMGFCEEQSIRLIRAEHSIICEVCNVRLGISSKIAESILVEPLSSSPRIP